MSFDIPNTITELVPQGTYYLLTVEVGIPETYGTIRSQTAEAILTPDARVSLTDYNQTYSFDAEETFDMFKPSKTFSQCPNNQPTPLTDSEL